MDTDRTPTISELHSARDGEGLEITGWFSTWDEDTDREAFHPEAFDKAMLASGRNERLDMMNLSRLNRSIVKLLGTRGTVTRTDKLRFLRRYLGGTDRIKELSQVCAQGLWFHRLWWSLSGQA